MTLSVFVPIIIAAYKRSPRENRLGTDVAGDAASWNAHAMARQGCLTASSLG
jgi:hypothetical protein